MYIIPKEIIILLLNIIEFNSTWILSINSMWILSILVYGCYICW